MKHTIQRLIKGEREKITKSHGIQLPTWKQNGYLIYRLFHHGTNYLLSRWRLRRATKIKGLVFTKGRPEIVNNGVLELGKLVRVWSTVFRTRLAVEAGAQLKIGDNCRLNGTTIAATRSITVGNNCRLAPFSHLMDSDYHDLHDRTKAGQCAPIVLKDNVWIGTRSIVLKGVTVHEGAVVASGAIVTRDVPAYTVVGGVPARVLKKL
jgi:maltose O-acetyltransferase